MKIRAYDKDSEMILNMTVDQEIEIKSALMAALETGATRVLIWDEKIEGNPDFSFGSQKNKHFPS